MRRRDAKKILRRAHRRRILPREEANAAWNEFLRRRETEPGLTIGDVVVGWGVVPAERWSDFQHQLYLESGVELSDSELLLGSDETVQVDDPGSMEPTRPRRRSGSGRASGRSSGPFRPARRRPDKGRAYRKPPTELYLIVFTLVCLVVAAIVLIGIAW